MAVKRYNGSSWDTVAGAGTPGAAGIVTSATAPSDTSVLWADTTVTTNNALIPAGGTTGQVLSKTSSSDYAASWATPAAGGMTLLSTTTLSGATTTISSIDQTYNNLQVMFSGITISDAGNGILIYVNGTQNQSFGVGQRSTDGVNAITSTTSDIQVPLGSTLGTDVNNSFVLNFYNYNSTTRYKPFQMLGFAMNNSGQQVAGHLGGGIKTNSAISSITFNSSGGTSFTAGTVRIFGVK
jgi:hypothetical protein